MTPVYASDRSQVQNWYAYDEPNGRYVFWDGGTNRSRVATGFWCPITGNIVDAPDKMLAAMPPVCLCGHIQDDRMIVTGFPHVTDIMPVVSDSAVFNPVQYFYPDPEARASFTDEVLIGPDLIEGSPCELVRVIQLPEEQADALETFRSLGPNAVARHPFSVWTTKRSVHLVANAQPLRIDHCRIREIVCEEQLQLIDYVL